MAISPLVRPTCLVFGTLGLIQGLVFLALALLAVLVHQCTITVYSDDTFTSFLPLVVGLYFQGEGCEVYNTTLMSEIGLPSLVTPKWLFVWIAVYVWINGLWIIFSVIIMSSCVYNNKTLHHFLIYWAMLALVTCGMDLALAIFFGKDFKSIISIPDISSIALLPAVPLAMLIISLKGGTLWLINFVGSISAIIATHNYIKHKDDQRPLFLERAGFLDRSPISAFEQISVPRPVTLDLKTGVKKRNISTVSDLQEYYLTHDDRRAGWQSPISDIPQLAPVRREWVIPDPDYSPTSTVNPSKSETDSQIAKLRDSPLKPIFPLRPSLKRIRANYDTKKDLNI